MATDSANTSADGSTSDSAWRLPEPNRRTERSKPQAPGLAVVATPIGNLRDVTLRALDVLAAADVIACEDTRVTRKLLAAYAIKTPLLAYHEHNAEQVRPKLIGRLKDGASVALVSDAGMPLISDPGHKLVRAACEAGIAVTVIPGPSAVLTALGAAALPSDAFHFAGFLPAKSAARRAALAKLATVPATLIVFESARRLAKSLQDMADTLGRRPAAVARELTKLHEEIRRDDLAALARHYAAAGPPKGEVTLVVGPPAAAPAADDATLDAMLRKALQTQSLRDAAAAVAGRLGLPKRRVYARALDLAGETDADADHGSAGDS